MGIYVVQMVGTPINIPAEISHLQLREGTYLIDGEQARDILLNSEQGGLSRMQGRDATPQDLPGATAAHPTTDEIAVFVQAARRRRGHPEQQPVATDRDSVLTALNELLSDH